MQQAVERAVAQALENHTPQLRDELVRRVLEGVGPQLDQSNFLAPSPENGAFGLLNAVLSIHGGTNQKEILRALLDAAAPYSGRTALFVIKAGVAAGWQGRGFADDDSIKDFALNVHSGAPEKALQFRVPAIGSASEMDTAFIAKFGAPAQDQVVLLPLQLKDKVAAIVYADPGSDPSRKWDEPALELLVAATSAWLEVVSLRKQAQKETFSESSATRPPVQTATSYSDPFAGHAPAYAGVNSAGAEMHEAPVTAVAAGAAAAAAPALDSSAQVSALSADQVKAQRFARLLMDEVKLYNQAKVTEGRKHKDLYERLKEDIEKSRTTYQKRYGKVEGSADFFQQELIRSLAEDDVALMGANFRS